MLASDLTGKPLPPATASAIRHNKTAADCAVRACLPAGPVNFSQRFLARAFHSDPRSRREAPRPVRRSPAAACARSTDWQSVPSSEIGQGAGGPNAIVHHCLRRRYLCQKRRRDSLRHLSEPAAIRRFGSKLLCPRPAPAQMPSQRPATTHLCRGWLLPAWRRPAYSHRWYVPCRCSQTVSLKAPGNEFACLLSQRQPGFQVPAETSSAVRGHRARIDQVSGGSASPDPLSFGKSHVLSLRSSLWCAPDFRYAAYACRPSSTAFLRSLPASHRAVANTYWV